MTKCGRDEGDASAGRLPTLTVLLLLLEHFDLLMGCVVFRLLYGLAPMSLVTSVAPPENHWDPLDPTNPGPPGRVPPQMVNLDAAGVARGRVGRSRKRGWVRLF